MSAIHRALHNTGRFTEPAAARYNPLQRIQRNTQSAWWWLALTLLLISLVLGLWRFLGSSGLLTGNQGSLPASLVGEPLVPEPPALPASSRIIQSQAELEVAGSEVPLASLTEAVPPAESEPVTEASTPAVIQAAEPASETTGATSPEATPEAEAHQPTPEPVTRQARPVPPVSSEPVAQPTSVAPARSPTSQAATATNTAEVLPSRRNNYEVSIQNAIASNNLERARSLLQNWITDEPANETPRLWLAKIYLAESRYAEVQRLLIGLNSTEALGLIAVVFERSQEFSQAAALYERLARAEPDNAQWWLRWAISQENNGQLAQARLLYQTYLEEFPMQEGSLIQFAQERYMALEGY